MSADIFGLVGTVVDNRYRVDSVVGEGAFGVVYRGWHLAFGHPIALKCLKVPAHFTSAAKAAFLGQFRGEGAYLSKLSAHPAIVRVFDLNVIERHAGEVVPYLVLEWLDGVELEEFLQERRRTGVPPMSEADAARFLRPVIEALAFAHELKIVHRDLKPRNLYLTRTRWGAVLKVLDFGIAKAMHEGETATHRATGTSSTFQAFTPDYGAPEQFVATRFGSTGPWTDVHALGLILTELVLGRRVYGGSALFELYEEATSTTRPTPRFKGANVSDAFEQLCGKALSANVAARFRDAQELLLALDRAVSPAPGADAARPTPVVLVADAAVKAVQSQSLQVPNARNAEASGAAAARQGLPSPAPMVAPGSSPLHDGAWGLQLTLPTTTQRADVLAVLQHAAADARPMATELGPPGGASPARDQSGVLAAPIGAGWVAASSSAAPGKRIATELQGAAPVLASHEVPVAAGPARVGASALIPGAPRRRHITKGRSAILGGLLAAGLVGSVVAGLVSVREARIERSEIADASAPRTASSASAAVTERLEAGAMLAIPAGSFMMGSNQGNPDEMPEHRVSLAAFEMDATEVTVSAYQHCVVAGVCTPRRAVASDWYEQHGGAAKWSRACNYEWPERASHPMNCVDWADADTFCKWAGKRLPTEEEWEYAARGPMGRKFPWGDAPPSPSRLNACGGECVAWVKENTGLSYRAMYTGREQWATTAPVGSFPAGDSPFGVHDMAGNVWEWTATNHCSYGRAGCSAVSRVNRGGSWGDWDSADVTTTRRSGSPPSIRDGNLGFRCARSR